MRGETKKQEFDSIAHLHDCLGNKKVAELHRSGKLMAMLKVSKPGDRFEKEADWIANRVMNTNPGMIHENSTAKVSAKLDLSKVSKKQGSTTETQIKNLSGGEKLDGGTKKFFKSRFDGLDLSNVNIHKSRKANKMTNSINARAFTYGNNIVFNKDEYKPNTFQGKKLLAHELAHVAQQNKFRQPAKVKMDEPGKKRVNALNINNEDRMKAVKNFEKRNKYTKPAPPKIQKKHSISQIDKPAVTKVEKPSIIKEETVSKTVAKSQTKSPAPPVKVSSTQNKVVMGWWGKKDDDKDKKEEEEDGKKPKGIGGFAWWAFKNLLGLIGIDVDQIMGILGKAGDALGAIVKDPKGFFGNLGKAVKGGINNFVGNFKKHLLNGIAGWLFGQLGDSGLEMPSAFNFKGILSIILQVIGLTYNNIRGQIVKGLGKGGEEMMSHAEGMFDHLKTAITEGPMALWEQLKEHLSGLKDQFFGMIIDWVKSTVIKQGVMFLISMLNPAGAVVQAVRAIIKVVTFFMERWQQIQDFASSVVDSVSLIAKGDTTAAQNGVENSLAKAMPLTISFIAKLVGLGGISKHIKKVIKKIQKPINSAVKKVTKKFAKKIKALPIFKKGKKALKKGKKAVDKSKKKLNEAKEGVDKAIDEKSSKMRKDIEDSRKDKEKKKEDEVKEKSRKGKNEHEKKEQLTEKDRKKHRVYASEIVQKLQADKGNNSKTFKEFHASKVKLAKDLEGRYQKKLKRGINIAITIPPLERDKKDDDVDFDVKIAPNTTRVKGAVKSEVKEEEAPDFSQELGKAHPSAQPTLQTLIEKIQKERKEKPIKKWDTMQAELKKEERVKKILDKPLNVSHKFGKDVSESVGEPAVLDANDEIAKSDPSGESFLGQRSAKSFLEVNKVNINKEQSPFTGSRTKFGELIFNASTGRVARLQLSKEFVKRIEDLKAGKHIKTEYKAETEELSEEEKKKLKLDEAEKHELESDAAKRETSREVGKELEQPKAKVKDIEPDLAAGTITLQKAAADVVDSAGEVVTVLGRYKGKVSEEADVAGVNIGFIDSYIKKAGAEKSAGLKLKDEIKKSLKKGKNGSKTIETSKRNELNAKAAKLGQNIRGIINTIINLTKTYSEKIAEKYTDKVAPKLYEGAERSYPGSFESKQGAGDVDRVYITEQNGKLIVVEVKGGTSSKGDRKVKHDQKLEGERVQQGTIEYLMDVAQEMVESADDNLDKLDDQLDKNEINESEYNKKQSALEEKKGMGQRIIDAISSKKIDYLLARQEFTQEGKLSKSSVLRFKLKWDRI